MANSKKPLAAALGAAFLATSISPLVTAESNPVLVVTRKPKAKAAVATRKPREKEAAATRKPTVKEAAAVTSVTT